MSFSDRPSQAGSKRTCWRISNGLLDTWKLQSTARSKVLTNPPFSAPLQLETERGTLEEKLRRVTEQWEDLRDQLSVEESARAELEKERDTLRKAIEDKDTQIQVRSWVRVRSVLNPFWSRFYVPCYVPVGKARVRLLNQRERGARCARQPRTTNSRIQLGCGCRH